MVDLQRRFILLQNAVVDQADLRGKSHCLHLIVGDIDEGRAGLDMQALQLVAHFESQLCVEVRKRLVHEQNRRLRSEGSGDGDTLLLPAGQLCRIPVHEHADFDDAADTADGEVDFLFGKLAHLRDDFTVFCIAEFVV